MKASSTRLAFGRFWKKVRIVGVDVPSGVSVHPDSLEEIGRGARNRARSAWGKGSYSVGIEAGQFQIDVLSKAIFQITLVCITDGKRESMGSGPFFELPRRTYGTQIGQAPYGKSQHLRPLRIANFAS